MSDDGRAAALRDFRRIPGVGRTIALYERLCELQGCHVDRCMLYVLRCAVYFASGERHDPELLKWWHWKDGGLAFRSGDTRP